MSVAGSGKGRHSVGLRRRVTAAFTENLGLKALAVLLTVVLWFVVEAREPVEESTMVRSAPKRDSISTSKDRITLDTPQVKASFKGAGRRP